MAKAAKSTKAKSSSTTKRAKKTATAKRVTKDDTARDKERRAAVADRRQEDSEIGDERRAVERRQVDQSTCEQEALSQVEDAMDDHKVPCGERREASDDRRQEDVEFGGERRKVQRRRQIDPTTCERDYSEDEIEFMRALDEYKRANGRMFPTCSEILEVVRALGYERVTMGDGIVVVGPIGNDEATEEDDFAEAVGSEL